MRIIQAKAEGRELPAAEPAAAPARTADLMDALRRSVEQVRKPPAKVEPRARPAAKVTRLEERKATTARRRPRAG